MARDSQVSGTRQTRCDPPSPLTRTTILFVDNTHSLVTELHPASSLNIIIISHPTTHEERHKLYESSTKRTRTTSSLKRNWKKPRDSRYPPINVKSPLISHSIKAIQELNVNWDSDDPGKCQASFISKPADVWALVIEVIEVRA